MRKHVDRCGTVEYDIPRATETPFVPLMDAKDLPRAPFKI
jgi:hypothetical protein